VNSEALASRLHDIRGLDDVGFWPPAPGWWLVIASVVLVAVLIRIVRRYPLVWRPSLRLRWNRDAARKLYSLRARIDHGDPKEIATELSELIRRIAIARCGRSQCAGLSGTQWLDWMSDHDPLNYDWHKHGGLLMDLTYAPPGGEGHRVELHEMLTAALAWVSHTGDCEVTSRPARKAAA